MMRLLGVLIAGVGLTLVSAPAAAQKSGEKLQRELAGAKAGAGKSATNAHREGEYGGVTPGKVSEKRRGPRKGKRPVVAWVGLRSQGGGASQFFVQLSRDADVQQEVVGNKLLVTIAGARFASRNARRRLDTRYFKTSVAGVVPRSVRRRRARKGRPGHAAGVQLTFSFKNPSDVAAASLRSGPEQDGFFYVFLDFAAGTDMPASE